jgi:hypothetical protein
MNTTCERIAESHPGDEILIRMNERAYDLYSIFMKVGVMEEQIENLQSSLQNLATDDHLSRREYEQEIQRLQELMPCKPSNAEICTIWDSIMQYIELHLQPGQSLLDVQNRFEHLGIYTVCLSVYQTNVPDCSLMVQDVTITKQHLVQVHTGLDAYKAMFKNKTVMGILNPRTNEVVREINLMPTLMKHYREKIKPLLKDAGFLFGGKKSVDEVKVKAALNRMFGSADVPQFGEVGGQDGQDDTLEKKEDA